MSAIAPHAVTVRLATSDDDAQVHSLFHGLHAFNATLDSRFSLADDWPAVLADHLTHERLHHHGATFLAWLGERAVGLLMMDGHTDSPLFLDRHWAELIALYVVPDQRGEGVADDLLDEGMAWAKDHGYTRIQLYVTTSNMGAKRFYGRSRFKPIQEIWCYDLPQAPGLPSTDLACESAYAHGHNLLSNTKHHLTADDEPCKEDETTQYT